MTISEVAVHGTIGDTCDPDTFDLVCQNTDNILYCDETTNKVTAYKCTDNAGYECATLEGYADCYEDITEYCSANYDIVLYDNADYACQDWDDYGVVWFSFCEWTGTKFLAYDYYASSLCDGNKLLKCSNAATYSRESCTCCSVEMDDESGDIYGVCRK